jgi:hypothetical protein
MDSSVYPKLFLVWNLCGTSILNIMIRHGTNNEPIKQGIWIFLQTTMDHLRTGHILIFLILKMCVIFLKVGLKPVLLHTHEPEIQIIF